MEKNFNYQHSSLGAIWGLGAPLIVSLVASIAIVIAGGEESALANSPIFNILVSILAELSFLFVFLLISKTRRVDAISSTGVKQPVPWYFYLICVGLGLVFIFLFNPIISLWEDLLSLLGYQLTSELSIPLDNAGWLVLALFAVGLLPAICEEFLFRGLILNGLRKFGAVWAIGFSAVMFSLMHMNLQQLPYTLVLGIMLGIIVYYTKNIWLSVLMHFVNNATAILIMYFSKSAEQPFVWWEALIAVLCVLGACALAYLVILLFKKKAPASNEPHEIASVAEKASAKRVLIAPIIAGVLFLIIFSLVKFGVL